ncbi:major facilitator superfamily domain-containing protein [Dipodascopsis uninucleata]
MVHNRDVELLHISKSKTPESHDVSSQNSDLTDKSYTINLSSLETGSAETTDPDLLLKHFLQVGPTAWTQEEEKKVLRKTDWRIMVWACVMFFSLELDRANISNVLTTDFLKQTDMTTQDYNLGQTVFLVCFLVMEIPSQMIIRYFGPEVWIPVMMSVWGAVAFCQAFIKSRGAYLATRALLGTCEGGFIPGLVLYLTSFYKSHELSVRFSWIWSTSTFTDVVSALLAVGILQMKHVHGWHDWQWLFLIEGLLTFVIGVLTAIILPSIRKPLISRVYTVRETAILRAKVVLDDDSKGRALERGRHLHISFKTIFNSLFDRYLFPIYLLGFFGFIPSLQAKQYMTINLKAMKFTTLQSNLLTIPGCLCVIFTMLIASWLADKYRTKWIWPIVGSIWTIPCLIALITLPDNASRWVRYTCSSLIVGYPYFHPILIAWISCNSNDHERRALSSAWYNIFVQCGKIAASNIYQSKDAPYYHTGNKALLGIACATSVISFSTGMWFKYENKKRDRALDAMTEEQREEYKATTSDIGNRRLDFKLNN